MKTVARRHGRSTVFGRMLRHYPFHVASVTKTNARLRVHVGNVYTHVYAYTRLYTRSHARTHAANRAHRFDRNRSSVEEQPVSVARSLMRQREKEKERAS